MDVEDILEFVECFLNGKDKNSKVICKELVTNSACVIDLYAL